MKKQLILPALTLALASGYGVQQEAQEAELKKKVTRLEQRLDQVEAYLAAQAQAEQQVVDAVEKAVEQGFTAGINFEARETLVAAWKSRAQAAAQGAPGAKAEEQDGEDVDPRVRRRRDR